MNGRWRNLASLAWRESRNARRTLLLYMSAISLGVAALVAIDSYASNVSTAVREQSRALLGGDLAFSSRQPFPESFEAIIDSIGQYEVVSARATTFASMAFVPSAGTTRLVQVRAVTDAWPLYGELRTEPLDAVARLHDSPSVLVDPNILVTLRTAVGDSLRIGARAFRIAGVLRAVPGEPSITAAFGPRVLISESYLASTQLLAFGSVAQHETFLRLPERMSPQRTLNQIRRQLDSVRVRGRTAAQSEENLTESIEELSDFLALVGLVALLLGGIGVASGVRAFVARKLDTVAVLRCLGASSGQVLTMYVAQAAIMGLAGALIGAGIGVAMQFALPFALGEFLPVDVSVSLAWRAIGSGLLVGAWVALIFALLPLVSLRRVPPLQALRRVGNEELTARQRRDPVRLVLVLALLVSVAAIAVSRTGDMQRGLGLSAAVAAVILALTGGATLLGFVARRVIRPVWPYTVRQGIANLYRPGNQTVAVILALGFGAFLITTVYLVQINLLRQFEVIEENSRGNLLLFDIQEDQIDAVRALALDAGGTILESTPIITMRVQAIKGTPIAELLEQRGRRGGRWAFQREYRSTYRDSLGPAEVLTAGEWFGANAAAAQGEVSLEEDIASELEVQLGDEITWNVQGVPITTTVTSLRRVEWGRLETNFFAVFGPGTIESAPKQFAMLSEVAPDAAGRLQGAIVGRFANVSAIDLTLVRETIDSIVGRATAGVRFMAIFSLALGIPVLLSAVAATRRERVREGVLLKTLGATRVQIARILLSEYLVLGALGAASGAGLALFGGWAAMHFIFDQEFQAVAPPMLLVAALALLITAIVGLASSRDVFRETPMAALRES